MAILSSASTAMACACLSVCVCVCVCVKCKPHNPDTGYQWLFCQVQAPQWLMPVSLSVSVSVSSASPTLMTLATNGYSVKCKHHTPDTGYQWPFCQVQAPQWLVPVSLSVSVPVSSASPTLMTLATNGYSVKCQPHMTLATNGYSVKCEPHIPVTGYQWLFCQVPAPYS